MKQCVILSFLILSFHAATAHGQIRAVYLGSNFGRTDTILNIAANTEINSVVIDIKDSAVFLDEWHQKLIARLNAANLYVTCRIVVFQDTVYAKNYPHAAIKKVLLDEKGERQEEFWWSGKRKWQRYWIDPTNKAFWEYNRDIALKGITAGCQEINFDYIRYPSDGDMKNIAYPSRKNRQPTDAEKRETMQTFFSYITRSLKDKHPATPLSVDIFGVVFLNGKEAGIGQYLEDIATYFDVIALMPYPSHYPCKEFGAQDPNRIPYRVYHETLSKGLALLNKKDVAIRPWLQAFSIANIYGCGGIVEYDRIRFREQIRAANNHGIQSWMAWNASANYSRELFNKK